MGVFNVESRLAAAVFAVAVLVAGEAAPAGAGRWMKLFGAAKGRVAGRPFCKPVLLPDGRLFIWGPPAKDPASDWTTGALDISRKKWSPLLPEGKEGWLKSRPKMRYGMRWGTSTWMQEGVNQPVPVCHFNQAAYVPTMKKVLYFVGDHTLSFDPATNAWEKLAPRESPPMVLWGALEYDPVNDEVVLFGGGAQCEENRPGTWVFQVKNRNWRKIEQPLSEQPPPRSNAPLAYDSKNELIAVFGGDQQDRYLSDTWVYDCRRRRWRELKTNVRPFPRSVPVLCYLEKHGVFMMAGAVPGIPQRPGRNHRPRGKASSETWVLDAGKARWTRVAGEFPAAFWTSAVYDVRRDRVLLHRARSKWGQLSPPEFHSWEPSLSPAGEGEGLLDPGEPVYQYQPPEWYTAGVPAADPKSGEKLLAGIKPNEWVAVEVPRAAYSRTWGSTAIDPDRHELLLWGGGHCGYCGTDVNHFSLKTLRWTTSFPPEFPPPPYSAFYGDESSFLINNRSFRGRPWVQHGRMSYAYDPVTKKVAFTQTISRAPTRGFTYIYDPEKRDFVDRLPQPFVPGWAVSGICVSTPRGIYNYLTRGDHRSKEVGLFKLDVKARKWVNLSGGKTTAPSSERTRMVYDSKRDRLVLVTNRRISREKSEPQMYAWDLRGAAADWARLEMSGEQPASFYRESVYIEGHDRILNLPRSGKGEKGVVYSCDLSDGNRWEKTGITLPCGVGPTTAMVYDPGLDVLVLSSARNRGPTNVWLMRYLPGR